MGKSTAVHHLAESFESYVEINFEKQSSYIPLFQTKDIDVKQIVSQMSAMAGKRIEPGRTLLFLDEVQALANSCCWRPATELLMPNRSHNHFTRN